jgi:hypothetical protein
VRGFEKAAEIEDADGRKEKLVREIERLSKHVTFWSEDLSVLSLDLSLDLLRRRVLPSLSFRLRNRLIFMFPGIWAIAGRVSRVQDAARAIEGFGCRCELSRAGMARSELSLVGSMKLHGLLNVA